VTTAIEQARTPNRAIAVTKISVDESCIDFIALTASFRPHP
jgi:hypothetical protein